jgi:hypothetical protein
MKASIVYLFACMLSVNMLQAQTSVNKAALFTSTAKESPGNVSLKPVTANSKVQKAFTRAFGENALQNWSIAGRNFLNSFYVDGVRTNVLYSPKGNLIYTIAYGAEQQLPGDVRKLVKSSYYDYDITSVTEVKENERHIWVVQLQNSKEVITARIENDEMEQVQQFNKPE